MIKLAVRLRRVGTEAVVRSINLLGDADSHGSITGQLAGGPGSAGRCKRVPRSRF